jgi:predicted transcriptional regulator
LGRRWEDVTLVSQSRLAPIPVRILPTIEEAPRFFGPPVGGFFIFRRGDFMSEERIDRVWRYKLTAQSLGISTKTLQRLVARGEIATVHITDRIRGITESERARFIKSRVVGAA